MSLRKAPKNDFADDSTRETSRLLRRPSSSTFANLKSEPVPTSNSIVLKTQTSIPQIVVPEVARAQERTAEQTPKILPAQRRAKRKADVSIFQSEQNQESDPIPSQNHLILWESRTLAHSPHPIARALRILFEAVALSALILRDDSQRADIKTFQFMTKYCVKPGARIGIWSGLTWSTDTSPFLWNSLIHQGWIEIPPYRTEGIEIKSTELLLVRKIFGLEEDSSETLTLIFSDPVVVAVFSKQSLESVKEKFREELHSAHEATGMIKALAA